MSEVKLPLVFDQTVKSSLLPTGETKFCKLPVVQLAKDKKPSPASPPQPKKEYASEDLGCRGKGEGKTLELVNLPFHGYPKVWARIQVDGNLKEGILEVDGEAI